MATIAYDKPVEDFIARLNATGHVTHTAYKKTSVTIHHNAGRLSHEGVLNVWKTRPASAHFDADGLGAIAQYVKLNEYAWAAGDTTGNMRSIHIEMANSSVGPYWSIAEVTWKSAARLAGWLFAKVIGVRPDAKNFFQHKHWTSTACAGPYTNLVWPEIMIEAQKSYDHFKGSVIVIGSKITPIDLKLDGDFGLLTKKATQRWIGVKDDGLWGPISKRALQRKVNVDDDGIIGRITINHLQVVIGHKQTGVWDRTTTISLQRYLNAR